MYLLYKYMYTCITCIYMCTYQEGEEVEGHSSREGPDEGLPWLQWQPHIPTAAHNSGYRTAPQHGLISIICCFYMYMGMHYACPLLPAGAVILFNCFTTFRDGN